MVQTAKQKTKNVVSLKQRSYQDIVLALDQKWAPALRKNSEASVLQLDKALGSPAKNLRTILVGGTNGKSLTVNFITQLLKAEGYKVGSFYAPHIVTYNERIAYNNESVTNAVFAETLNEVLNAAESLDLDMHAYDLLAMAAIVHFTHKQVDVAVFETSYVDSFDAATLCNSVINIITRVTNYASDASQQEITRKIELYKPLIKKGTWVISADQNKANLQLIQHMTEQAQAHWAMPIRKLATLKYPFEQLHGRCAALAERAAQLLIQEIVQPKGVDIQESLIAKPKGQRGRPTLEAKRQSDLNPKKTIEQYWQETTSTIPGRFELIEKGKPRMLLDSANNVDAFKNLLLGIRLLHYKHQLKGLTIIVGCEDNTLLTTEFYKMARYFFKKTAGQMLFCPIATDAQNQAKTPWDVEQITNDIKNVKVKAKSFKSLTQALEYSQKAVDEEQGMIVITGSRALLTEYWQLKGSKK